jgi:hypothetical protein
VADADERPQVGPPAGERDLLPIAEESNSAGFKLASIMLLELDIELRELGRVDDPKLVTCRLEFGPGAGSGSVGEIEILVVQDRSFAGRRFGLAPVRNWWQLATRHMFAG